MNECLQVSFLVYISKLSQSHSEVKRGAKVHLGKGRNIQSTTLSTLTHHY